MPSRRQDTVEALFAEIGAEVEQRRENKYAAMIDGFNGVDSDVPKTVVDRDLETGRQSLKRETRRMAAPANGQMLVTTSGGKRSPERLTALRNRYKLARSAFQFAPPDDKEARELDMDIAFHEMQGEAFRNKLALYERNPGRMGHAEVSPNQVKIYKRRLWEHDGALTELLEKKAHA